MDVKKSGGARDIQENGSFCKTDKASGTPCEGVGRYMVWLKVAKASGDSCRDCCPLMSGAPRADDTGRRAAVVRRWCAVDDRGCGVGELLLLLRSIELTGACSCGGARSDESSFLIISHKVNVGGWACTFARNGYICEAL